MRKKPNETEVLLDKEIIRVIRTLERTNINSDEYGSMADHLGRLYKIRGETLKKDVDPNVIISAATSVISIGMILNYERLGIVTSKALSLVRGRV